MKLLMLKQKSKLSKFSFKLSKLSLVLIVLLLVFGILATSGVFADQFQKRIDSLEEANSENRSQLGELEDQANSYEDAIHKLRSKINALENQIDANNQKKSQLEDQIAQVQEQINQEKKLLGESIRALYVQGQISTIEMLASSENLSDFVDKEVYHSAVRDKIKSQLDVITELKLQLQNQKDEIEALIKDLTNQQNDLAAAKQKQDELLGYNQDQQDTFNHAISKNQAKINVLRQQQAIENAKHFAGYTIVPGHNGRDTYPNIWRNAPQDSLIDKWGMFNRECVSYTAWKVASTGRYMPYWGGHGNANQWPGNAKAAGIPVSSTPKAGDVAIAYWGSFGHAMYVDSVNGDGTINISQYNWDYHGTYSEIYHFNTSGLVFIHFK